MEAVRLRVATPADVPGLIELERLAPEAGPVAVRVDFHGDYLALGSRREQAVVYLAEDDGVVVGTVSAVTRQTRLNDGWAPTTYLFRLRVHPAWRRQGVAARLVEHACAEARREHDTRVAWGAVLARNRASLELARAVGFRPVHTIGFRVLPTRWPAPGRARRVRVRPAGVSEWPGIAAQAEALYGDCQFWPRLVFPQPSNAGARESLRPRKPTDSESPEVPSSGGSSGPAGDTWVWVEDGAVRASAAVFDLSALATVSVVAQYPGLGVVTGALARLGGLPDLGGRLRVGLVCDLTFAPERPADGAALVGALLRQLRPRLDFLIVAGDPAHSSGRVLRRLAWGMPGRAVVVARSLEPLDRRRPVYFTLA